MLSFFTYYSDGTHPVRQNAGKIEIVDCTSDDTDRLLHYNYGNERWQRGKPMTDISFRNVRATRIKMPVTAWGDRDVPVRVSFKDCEIGFSMPQKEFMRGAYISAVDLENVKVTGDIDGPLLRLWRQPLWPNPLPPHLLPLPPLPPRRLPLPWRPVRPR